MIGACELDKNKNNRMSFVFPPEFYVMLNRLKEKYGKDMTYIVMEAVNQWVMEKENISLKDLSDDKSMLMMPCSGNNNGNEKNKSMM
jgi:predicted DNA-binding protein